jgi:hypothetical protein
MIAGGNRPYSEVVQQPFRRGKRFGLRKLSNLFNVDFDCSDPAFAMPSTDVLKSKREVLA